MRAERLGGRPRVSASASVALPETRSLAGRAWPAAVWLASAVYAALLSAESIDDHRSFESGVDTAVYDQQLWLLAHGDWPFSTVITRPFLAGHFEPALVLLTPLYWLDLGVPGMLALQSIGLALAAPALYWLARTVGAPQPVAAIPAVLWLICPWVAAVNLFEFRPDAFGPALLVLAAVAALHGRHLLLAVSVVLALGLKEDFALVFVMLGIVLAVRGERRTGALLAAGSAAWFVAASVVIRELGGSFDAFGRRFAGERGDTVGEALVWAATHPLETVSDIGSQSAIGLVALLLSTGALALLAPTWLLLAAPSVAYNALSAYESQHDLVHHYHLGTVTGLFIAAAVGVARLPSLGPRGRILATVGVASAVLVSLLGGVRVHTVRGDEVPLEPGPTRRALAVIPDGVPVAATRTLLPHLSQRKDVYTLPEPFEQIDWGSSLTRAELLERAPRIRYVAYAEGDQVGTFFTGELGRDTAVPDIRPRLEKLGFVVVARAGTVEVLARRDG
jgi:uncharacterized membrane protein